MTESSQPEDVAAYNEKSLQTLARAIRLSQGQFRLILARCNYEALRDRMVQRLRELSPVKIQELTLPKSVKKLYTAIHEALGDEQPKALMVFGLELVSDLSTALTSSNYVREEFPKSFPFPLVLWINDEVLQKLIRLAPDLESWATSVGFMLSTDELIDFLEQKTDQIFTSYATPNIENRWELEAAWQDLQSCEQLLYPDLEARLEFVRGLDNFANKQIDSALKHYKKSLFFWQKSNHLERQGILLSCIAFCYWYIAERHRTDSQHFWKQTRNYLKQCLNIFVQAQLAESVAAHISKLGEVYRRLQAWEELQNLAKKSLILHQRYSRQNQVAQDYGFLAEVALKESRWQEAKQLAQEALNILERNPEIQSFEIGFYHFILAQSHQNLGRFKEAINNLKQARQESNSQYNPQLYIDILENLYSLHFQQNEYLKAFEIKQDKRLSEYQFGFQAFAGASHLQPKQHVIRSTFAQTGQEAIVAQEIAASGREQFVKRLIERIRDNHHKLTVIHGQSGVGKSSIIQAGLVPALRQQAIGERDALPIVLRVYTDWVRMFGRCFAEAFEQVRSQSLPAPADSKEIIIKQLQKNADHNLLTILIFDQFEEFFFVCKELAKRKQFYEFLGMCLNVPFVKVILSLREDYLHYLLECNRLNHLDAINHNILDKDILCYLGNFSRNEAKVVVESLTNRSQFYLDPELIDELVKDLAVEFDSVRPIELQVVGAQLQEEQITTLEKYRRLGDNPKEVLVKQYLEGVIRDCGKENERIARLVLYWLTDENLTRPLKARTELAKDLAASGLKVKANKLDLVLPILVGSGLVVRVPESLDDRYQIVHDYLVAFIRQQQGAEVEELRKEAEFQRRRAEELQLGQSDALRRYSEALFNQGKELDALIEGLRAGIPLKQVGEAKAGTRIRVVTALRQVVYGVRECNRLEGHSDEVWRVVFSPDGKTLASASNDNTIRLWSRDGRQLATFSGHSNAVTSVVFSPDGKMLASASRDKTIRVWSRDGKELATLTGHSNWVSSIVFSPDAKTLASASDDTTIRVWSRDGKELATLTGRWAGVTNVVFSPDGKTLASSSSNDKTIRLWSSDGKELATLTEHSDWVSSLVFSPDGKMLASASRDKTIKLWHRSGKKLTTLTGHWTAVTSVVFSPDGKMLASGSRDKTIKLWSKDGEELATLTGHNDTITSVAFSPDGKTLASASNDNTIRLWSRDGRELATLTGHNDTITSIVFSPDGKTLASASRDKTIRLWSTGGNLLDTFSKHWAAVTSIVFSPDGKTFASVSNDQTIIIWGRDGKELATLTGRWAGVTNVVFNPDGKTLALSASNDKSIRLWSSDGKELATLTGHRDWVSSVVFSPDGKTLASASYDNTIRLWSKDGKELTTLNGHWAAVTSVVFSPDGKTLASASRDNNIRLWSGDGRELVTLTGHWAAVTSVVFSPDGKTLASASYDNTIRLWSRDGQELATLTGHSDTITGLVFSPDGKMLASASRDKTIRLWNRDGQELATLTGHWAAVTSVVFSPDGEILASGSYDRTVILWNLGLDNLLVHGCNWVRDYLKNNPNVSESDRQLCDGIRANASYF